MALMSGASIDTLNQRTFTKTQGATWRPLNLRRPPAARTAAKPPSWRIRGLHEMHSRSSRVTEETVNFSHTLVHKG